MLDIGSSELLMIVIVAVVVVGPKDLPRALYKIGQLVGKARAMSRHFRSGIDAMVREVEMEEMERKWAAENRRIMESHPAAEALPAPADEADTVAIMAAGSADMPGDGQTARKEKDTGAPGGGEEEHSSDAAFPGKGA